MFDKNELNRIATGHLKELYEQVTGIELHRHSDQWEGKCFVCGHTIFLSDKTPDHFYCRQCGKQYRGIDIITNHYGLTERNQFAEACQKLAELLGVTSNCAQYNAQYGRGKQLTVPQPVLRSTMPDIPSEEWQRIVTNAVKFAHDILMHDEGRPVREYLTGRGFTEDTLRRYRIGYNPTEYLLSTTDDKGNWIKASTGIYIPTFIRLNDEDPHESLLRVKVRCEDWKYKALKQSYDSGRIKSKPNKYYSITGSKGNSLFCAEYARDFPDRIIYVEGEFDAMTINQCAADICHAVSFGSHSSIGTAENWQAWYRVPENTVICFDNDPDPKIYEAVRKNEQKLQTEITKAQSLDCEEYRANAPIIRNLPEQYHDWNDILKDHGAQKIREILLGFFRI